MLDLYLCFADHAEAVSVLQSIGVIDVEGSLPVDGSAGGVAFALDLLFGNGVLLDEGGGNAGPVPGCHVNLRWCDAELPPALSPFRLAPVTPAVRWQ